MTASNYIGVNGLVVQDMNAIVRDLKNQFMGVYGADINLEQNTADGQWINILAQEKKDILDLYTQYYNNLDVDRVMGVPQQILYKLNGLTIKAFSYSFVFVEVTVNASTTLAGLDENIDSVDGVGYTVRDNNGNRWILANTANLEAGVHSLNFRAADLGGVQAQANTIKIMESVVAGITSVNNPTVNYITGNTGESASEFRLRRNRSVAMPSQGFEESIEAQILQLDNVADCKCYSNRTDTTQNGIPPRAVWTIVQGGNAQEFGKVIYYNVPPGIPMYGAESVDIVKSNGGIATIEYGTPRALYLYIMATIKNFSSSPLDEDYIAQQLSQQLLFKIGERAESATVITLLKNLLGETGTPFEVEISIDNINWAEYLLPIDLDQYFAVKPENIMLTIESM